VQTKPDTEMNSSGETADTEKEASCANCKMRAWADRRPRSILARLWRWHTTWCPGWKKYQQQLAEQEAHEQPADAVTPASS
jgi:hypothetical protein